MHFIMSKINCFLPDTRVIFDLKGAIIDNKKRTRIASPDI